MKSEKFLAWLAFGIICLVWGTTYLGIRVAIETLPTFLLIAARFVVAGSILLGICKLRGERIPTSLSDWANLGFIGIMLIGVGNGAVVWAEHFVVSGFAALLVATSPIWMAAMEAMRKDGERLTTRKIIGILIGFAGVGILVSKDLSPSNFNPHFLLGVIVLQIGSICWNFGSIRSKYHPVKASPLVSAAIQMLVGGTVMGIVGLAMGELPQFHFSTRSLIAYLYLMIFGSIVAYGAYVYALSKIKTSTLSLYAYINPAVAVVLGWAILDEPLGVRAILAMLVIFGGVALVQTGRKPRLTYAMPKTEAIMRLEAQVARNSNEA